MAGFTESIWKGALHFVWIVPVVALLSGSYTDAVRWRDHRVTVQIADNINVKDVASNLQPEDFRQINCLAVNMYFEAGNQGKAGMAAVGDVVFNRLKSGVFPDRVCQIVIGGKRNTNGKLLNGCDFSWMCDGTAHKITDKARYADAYEVAYNQYLYREKMPDITGGSTYYHADYVDPHNGVWKTAKPVVKIGAHIFFKKPQVISTELPELPPAEKYHEKGSGRIDKIRTLR